MKMTLPDFEDMMKIAEEISNYMLVADTLDIEIKEAESNVFKVASTDPNYFSNNKPLSTTAIKETYEYTGLNGELIEKRKLLAQAKANLEFAQLRFTTMKMMVDVYRTESANQRSAVL